MSAVNLDTIYNLSTLKGDFVHLIIFERTNSLGVRGHHVIM